MRRLWSLILLSFLLLAFSYAYYGGFPKVKASHIVFQGDLILSGNNVTIIEGQFDINGSIIVEENATLVLTNAIVNFTQSGMYQYSLTLRDPSNGNPHLQAENSTITSNHYVIVHLYENSTASASNLTIDHPIIVYCHDSAVVDLSDSLINSLYVFDDGVNATLLASVIHCSYIMGNSNVSLSDASLDVLQFRTRLGNFSISDLNAGTYASWNFLLDCSVVVAPGGYAPNLTLSNSSWNLVEFIVYDSNGTISNSTLRLQVYGDSYIQALGCEMTSVTNHDSSIIWAVDTNVLYYGEIMGSCRIYLLHYLDVHVLDSVAQDVSSAIVSAFYMNSTLAESETTDSDGWARLTLIEKMRNATGEYPAGNYTVEAEYNTYSNSTSANMTGNQQVTLTLNGLVIPEFPSVLILPFFMIVALLAVLVYRRKHNVKAISVWS